MPRTEDINPEPPKPGQPPPPAAPKPHGPPPGQEPAGVPPRTQLPPPGQAPAGQGPALTGEVSPGTPPAAWEHTHREVLSAQDSHHQVTTPQASGPRPAAPPPEGQQPTHYVVLHSALGGAWRQGEVLKVEQVPETERARLLALGAIRPASEQERVQEKVTLQGTGPAPALETMLADVRKEADRLRAENSQLREDLRVAKGQAPHGPAPTPPAPDMKVVAEKDKAIQDLTRQLQEAQAQLREAKGQSSPQQQPLTPPEPPSPPAVRVPGPTEGEDEDRGPRARGRR